MHNLQIAPLHSLNRRWQWKFGRWSTPTLRYNRPSQSQNPQPIKLTLLRHAIDTIDAKAVAALAAFDDGGALPTMRALDAFAQERAAFVSNAAILEQDRAALLQIWSEIRARIADNLSWQQGIANNLTTYRKRLASHRIAIAEYLVVGAVPAAKRLAAEAVDPSNIGDLAPAPAGLSGVNR
jgi:hypothetical protein